MSMTDERNPDAFECAQLLIEAGADVIIRWLIMERMIMEYPHRRHTAVL